MPWVYQQTDLKAILKGVSRSFYLSLVWLPKRVRRTIGLAFLSCKGADTIADTEIIGESERLLLLEAYRGLFTNPVPGSADRIVKEVGKPGGGSPAEQELIRYLPALMDGLEKLPSKDWHFIQELVLELTHGMQTDLSFFKSEKPETVKALDTLAQLERYTYDVAGCVGKFWTRMMAHHFRFGKNFTRETYEAGETLGKGLQLVNILRDLPRDLRLGRCYIPKELLCKEGLKPGDLLENGSLPKARPSLITLLNRAQNYLRHGKTYSTYYPCYARRLQAVVKLPMRLGFKTLDLLENSPDWLDPAKTHKVSRRQVYQTLLGSV